jgi:hypothetical protein
MADKQQVKKMLQPAKETAAVPLIPVADRTAPAVTPVKRKEKYWAVINVGSDVDGRVQPAAGGKPEQSLPPTPMAEKIAA